MLFTLADLYVPLSMPANLARAHVELDRAMDRCYRREPFHSDREQVDYIFTLHEHLTAPLLPAKARLKRRARRHHR